MFQQMLFWFLIAFIGSFLLTRLFAWAAARIGLTDKPALVRKIHTKAIPLAGGVAIFMTLAGAIAVLLHGQSLTSGLVGREQYVGFLLGGLILLLGGVVDDKYVLPPRLAIIAPIFAAACAILFGIEIEKISNPFGGQVFLDGWQSDLLVFIWLLVAMYTTKFLDGLDGLATSISSVGALMVMLLALTAAYFQPDVALFAVTALGAFCGFLLWNIHPARVFLGEGGSTLLGYTIGVLAVISGSKVATALLVLGIPFLDVIWVMLRRFRAGGVRAMFVGDKKHLHHRLLERGWGQRRIVLAYVVTASVFGTSALFLQSKEKLVALILLTGMMVLLAWYLVTKPIKT